MKKILLTCMAFLTLSMTSVLANENPFWRDDDDNIDGTVQTDLTTAVTTFINYALGFLGLLVVTMFIYAGVLFVTAQGDEKQIEKAKKIMLWSVVGVLVIMLSFVIVNAITGARNISE